LWVEARLAGKKGGNLVFLVGLALLLTLSKAFLLYLAYVLLRLIETYVPSLRIGFSRAIVIAAALVLYGGTHMVWQPPGPERSGSSAVLVDESFISGSHGDLYLTSYSALKMANVHLFKAHPWFGVGPGQSQNYLPSLKNQGKYPAHLGNYEPHSTLVGAASETGIFGLLSLLLLMGYSVYTFLPLASSSDPTPRALVYFLLFLLLTSVQQDVMNFRFLWVVWGLMLGSVSKK